MTDETHAALARHLDRVAPPSSPDASQRVVAALEDRLGGRLPDEFRTYLLAVAPDREEMDQINISWWPPDRIRTILEECGPDTPSGQVNAEIEAERDQYVIFADYLIWCYAWAICCSEGPNRGRVALIGASPDRFVAESFADFVEKALAGSASIHA